MRKTLIILIILVTLGAGGIWVYQNLIASPGEPQQEREEAAVTRGSLAAMVNTTGSILPEKETTLSFKSPGRVAEVLVQEGQLVHAGEVLARLETADLEFAVTQAQVAVSQANLSLATAQAQLLLAERPPAEYDVAAAQAAVDSARAAYQRLLAGPSKEEIQVARTNLDQAEAALKQAQLAYNRVAGRPDVAMLPESLQLEQATIAYRAAQANFELTTRPASEAERKSAQSAIAQAEAALARLQEGVTDEDLLAAQLAVEQANLGVEQAQLSLDQAQHQLEGTVLTAPHDGTITLVGVQQGELSGGQPAFILTDLSRYHIDVTVDEIDIGRVAEGQPVTVTLDALPGETLTGQIEQIADTAQLDSGVVTYKLTIHLDPTAAPLRVGMTTNVDIVTERRDQVLLVPNRYVRIDRTTGKAYVDRAAGSQVQPIEIQIGLRDETYSEVLAGLQEGDTVVLIKESSKEQLQRAMDMGGP
jgi:HlyD family secretion protein